MANNKITLVVLIIILVFPGLDVQAQDSVDSTFRSRMLGIEASVSLASYREDLLVPISFDGPTILLGLLSNHWTDNSHCNIRLRFGIGYLQNRFSHEAAVLKFDLYSSWVKKVKTYQGHGELWAGISIPVQMNNLFLFSWDDAHLYWLTVYSLGPAIGWKKNIGKEKQVYVQLGIPFINWISRPSSYKSKKQEALNHLGWLFSEPNKSLHIESFEDYRSFNILMTLVNPRKHSGWNFGLEFQYDYFRNPKPFSRLSSSLLCSYLWGMGK